MVGDTGNFREKVVVVARSRYVKGNQLVGATKCLLVVGQSENIMAQTIQTRTNKPSCIRYK
jgi:hypothetical protein